MVESIASYITAMMKKGSSFGLSYLFQTCPGGLGKSICSAWLFACSPRVKISGPRFEDVALYITELLPDVFDFEKSDYDKGEGGYVVYKAVLKIPESYRGEIFRISESPQLLYVSQVFKDAVELSGLKGLNFREVERSDIGGCSD